MIRGRFGVKQITILSRSRAVGIPAVLAIAAALSVMTANECHHNLALNHITAPYFPSLLFGITTWFWWAGFALGLWWWAQRKPSLLTFSWYRILCHSGVASLFAIAHLELLQHVVWMAGAHWPSWGRLYSSLYLRTSERFGTDLIIYGCMYCSSGFLYSQWQTQQTVIQKLEVESQLTQAQLKALQMQMEPHFLFNTLNAITSLVVQGRNAEAVKTMNHLNTILRKTLQRKAPEKVPFPEELRVVESYLAIQQVRFAGRLEVKIDATDEAMDGLVPCFLLQPLVENAIQHGIAPKRQGGSIETYVKRVGDKLWMQVKDDGCGSNSATKGHGIGMQNIQERLAYFYPGGYEFYALSPATGGYEVTIQIPYERATV